MLALSPRYTSFVQTRLPAFLTGRPQLLKHANVHYSLKYYSPMKKTNKKTLSLLIYYISYLYKLGLNPKYKYFKSVEFFRHMELIKRGFPNSLFLKYANHQNSRDSNLAVNCLKSDRRKILLLIFTHILKKCTYTFRVARWFQQKYCTSSIFSLPFLPSHTLLPVFST